MTTYRDSKGRLPKYPIVDPDPSLGRTLANFNVADYGLIAGHVVTGYAFGFFLASKKLRTPNARFVGAIGLLWGVGHSYLNSTQRFMGLMPNESEVRRFGVSSVETLEEYERMLQDPNRELIDAYKYKKE